MLYQIILKNFKSSWKNYFVYFTGNIIGVAEFFVFLGLYSVSKVIMKDASADFGTIQDIMLACILVCIFSVAIMTYSMQKFMRLRLREYQLFYVLGMKRRKMYGMILFEYFSGCLGTLFAGMLAGRLMLGGVLKAWHYFFPEYIRRVPITVSVYMDTCKLSVAVFLAVAFSLLVWADNHGLQDLMNDGKKKEKKDKKDEQIAELKEHAEDINYDVAKAREKVVRHDVMSHVYAYGQQCPKAKGIIHLGATSCYVGDNTDIIIMAEALKLVKKKLVNVLDELSKFADQYKDLPTLAFTHFQPAQPTTVGKRATLWMQEFSMDLADLDYVLGSLKLLGSKGTTGTQASFLELFEGDQETIDKIDPMIAKKMGFEACYPVSGQTYSRKVDTRVVNVLAGIAASAHKFSNDIRLLQHLKEVEEPFEKTQIGSSAMAYKRNPMRSERIASLSRYVMIDALNPAITSATQWFERTLDDSANKRLSVPEGFLAIDGILDLCLNVVDGLVVYPKVIEKRLMSELPFMATENIMMDAVKAGGDRQELHERIRELSMEAGKNVKEKGLDNNLLELIASDDAFNLSLEDLQKTMDPSKYVGRSKEQVEAFLKNVIRPILDENKELLGVKAEINV